MIHDDLPPQDLAVTAFMLSGPLSVQLEQAFRAGWRASHAYLAPDIGMGIGVKSTSHEAFAEWVNQLEMQRARISQR